MSNKTRIVEKLDSIPRKPIIITLLGTIITIILIIITLDISHRNINIFITTQQKYIISIEGIILMAFIVELLVRLTTLRLHAQPIIEHGSRLRLIVRIVGYSIGSLSVVSILSANATLGISIGAITGIVIAFATQNIVGSVLAAILILSTRLVKVGEEITVSQIKGIVSDINLTHTVLSIDNEVVFIPNSLMISSIVRRKKRNTDQDTGVTDW